MLVDGEKYACEACVRGHRVSSCTHSDRRLQHINKKGRPVSQCPHCRGLRKARSSHVKCECGDKDGHIKKELIDGHACACSHGQRCTCNIKKEHLEPISEFKHTKARSRANTEGRKPRLTANNSDPAMTVFTNGHHKPVHRNNHAGHDFAPYKIPRPHSIHGSSALAQRSMDNLTLGGYGNQNSMFAAALSNLQRDDQRLVRSAHGSPGLYPSRFDQFGQLPNLDLNFPAYNTSITSSPSGDEYMQPFQTAFENYVPKSDELPPRSTPINAPAYNWSAVDLPLDVGTLPAAYHQPPSYASLDQSHMSGPEMTNTSSAELSEVEDYTTQGVLSPALGEGSPFLPSPPDNGGQFSSTESFHNTSAPFNPTLDAITMDSFIPRSPTSPFDPHDLSNNISPDPEAFTRHGMTVQDAQKLAHPGYTSAPISVHNPISGQAMMPMTTAPTSDPSWAAAYTGIDEDPTFVPPALQMHDQNWVN